MPIDMCSASVVYIQICVSTKARCMHKAKTGMMVANTNVSVWMGEVGNTDVQKGR